VFRRKEPCWLNLVVSGRARVGHRTTSDRRWPEVHAVCSELLCGSWALRIKGNVYTGSCCVVTIYVCWCSGLEYRSEKVVLSVLHELAQSVQKNIYILKLDCMCLGSVYRSPLVYKDNTQLIFEHAISCFKCPKIMHVANCTTTGVGCTVASLMISMLVYN
jgi:hypothetical protein